MTAIITVKNLTRVFDVSKPWLNRVIERLPKSFLTAVSNVEFDVEQKTVYALVEESGSGKSTIGKMVVGLLDALDGRVELSGVDLSSETDSQKLEAVRSNIQMIFQDPYASLNPRWKIMDIIAEPVAAPAPITGKNIFEPLLINWLIEFPNKAVEISNGF